MEVDKVIKEESRAHGHPHRKGIRHDSRGEQILHGISQLSHRAKQQAKV